MLYSLTIHNCPSVFVISSFLCNSIIYQTNGGRKREENSRKNYTEIKAKISLFIFVISSASYHCVCLSVCMYVIFNTFRHTKAKKKQKQMNEHRVNMKTIHNSSIIFSFLGFCVCVMYTMLRLCPIKFHCLF